MVVKALTLQWAQCCETGILYIKKIKYKQRDSKYKTLTILMNQTPHVTAMTIIMMKMIEKDNQVLCIKAAGAEASKRVFFPVTHHEKKAQTSI